jgi:hypothetical protein
MGARPQCFVSLISEIEVQVAAREQTPIERDAGLALRADASTDELGREHLLAQVFPTPKGE